MFEKITTSMSELYMRRDSGAITLNVSSKKKENEASVKTYLNNSGSPAFVQCFPI